MGVMTIGARLNQLLKESGKTQAEIARYAGVGRGAISAIVTGRTKNPQPEHVFLIADALGVEPRWLATGKGQKKKKDSGLSQEQKAWLDLYELVPPAKRQAAREILDPSGEYRTHDPDGTDS